jgi:hypothetical protein
MRQKLQTTLGQQEHSSDFIGFQYCAYGFDQALPKLFGKPVYIAFPFFKRSLELRFHRLIFPDNPTVFLILVQPAWMGAPGVPIVQPLQA